MGLSVQNPAAEWKKIVGREKEVEVLEGLRKEEALLYIVFFRIRRIDVCYPGISAVRTTEFFDSLEKAKSNDTLTSTPLPCYSWHAQKNSEVRSTLDRTFQQGMITGTRQRERQFDWRSEQVAIVRTSQENTAQTLMKKVYSCRHLMKKTGEDVGHDDDSKRCHIS